MECGGSGWGRGKGNKCGVRGGEVRGDDSESECNNGGHISGRLINYSENRRKSSYNLGLVKHNRRATIQRLLDEQKCHGRGNG